MTLESSPEGLQLIVEESCVIKRNTFDLRVGFPNMPC